MIERLAKRLSLTASLGHAVDVGCGTGLSSVALTAIAERVSAFDPSAEMLAAAPPHERVTYAVARAEELPLYVTGHTWGRWSDMGNRFRAGEYWFLAAYGIDGERLWLREYAADTDQAEDESGKRPK